MSSPLAPTAFMAISAAASFIAIRQPYKDRVYLSPAIFGSAVMSLLKSSSMPSFAGLNVLWALFVCYWIQHFAAVLYIDQLSIPLVHGSSWISTYKVSIDPRRQAGKNFILWQKNNTFSNVSSTIVIPSSMKRMTRMRFVVGQILKLAIFWFLQLFIISPASLLYFRFTAEDFTPSRQVFIRRLLSLLAMKQEGGSIPSPIIIITLREIQIRLFISAYWIWTGYLILDLWHVLLSILFVGILRFDSPEEWARPLFGSPAEAYSVRRFWSKFWHGLTVPASVASGRLISRRLIGMTSAASRLEKVFLAFWTFLTSGFAHEIANALTNNNTSGRLGDDMFFFLANFAVVVIESLIINTINQIMEKSLPRPRGALCLFLLNTATRIMGFAWVLAFFFWITPKWQYPKIYDVLKQYEQVQN